MRNPVIATLLHTLAVAVALVVAWLLIHWFGIENQNLMVVIGLLVIALEKLIRAVGAVPVKDWVNGD